MIISANCTKCGKLVETTMDNEQTDKEIKKTIVKLVVCSNCKILTDGRNISVLLHALELLPVKEKQTYGSTIKKLNSLLNEQLNNI